MEWAEERERLQQQVSTQRQRGLEKTAKLEEELLALQREREAEISSHQNSMVRDERGKEIWRERWRERISSGRVLVYLKTDLFSLSLSVAVTRRAEGNPDEGKS